MNSCNLIPVNPKDFPRFVLLNGGFHFSKQFFYKLKLCKFMELEIELIEVSVFCLEQVAHFGVLGRALGQCFVSAFIKISFELICKWLVTGRLSASAPKSDGCGAKVEIWIWIVDAALCCLGRPPVIDSSAAWGTSASAECRPRETSHRGVAVDGNLVDLFLFLFLFFWTFNLFFFLFQELEHEEGSLDFPSASESSTWLWLAGFVTLGPKW